MICVINGGVGGGVLGANGCDGRCGFFSLNVGREICDLVDESGLGL